MLFVICIYVPTLNKIYLLTCLDTHWANPQFSVTLSDRDEDGDNVCSLVIQLMQKDGRKLKQFGKKNQHIGFFVYQVQFMYYCRLEHHACLFLNIMYILILLSSNKFNI